MKRIKSRNISIVAISYVLLALLSIISILPLTSIVFVSLSSEKSIMETGFGILPKDFTFSAYKLLFENLTGILRAYTISIFVTVTGTVFGLLITAMMAYPLSRNDFKYKKQLSFYVFFTMLFNGGMVPFYILVSKYLHLGNSVWALILPFLVNAYFVLIMRTFMLATPFSIIESAKIDGASEFKIFFTIIIPLSKPALATIGFLIALTYWNDWWLSLLFITNNDLAPLQFMLQRMLTNIQFVQQNISVLPAGVDSLSELPNQSLRMAMCVIAIGPMMFVLPFFQKYFVKGLTIGSVKG